MPATELLNRLEELRQDVLQQATRLSDVWGKAIERETFRESARNMACYLALRQHDLRDLQSQLMPWGLSSLGRSESRVMETLDSVIKTLRCICGETVREECSAETFFRGDDLLDLEVERVLGPASPDRRVRIMVTFPTEAASDYEFVREMLVDGMNVARINCAHDSPADWLAMVGNIRRAERETGLTCKIAMDLAGPKIRVQQTNFKKSHRFVSGDVVLLAREITRSKRFPFQVTCSLAQAVEGVQSGEGVWFDDGIMGAVVDAIVPEGAVLRITHVAPDGERIRPEKGINFPNTDLFVPALTNKDLEDLDFVAQHADIVDYSFVQSVDDIRRLHTELSKRITDPDRRASLAIVAKIETRLAVVSLPEIIVAGAGLHPFSVMIARGDLAVEIGFERLAEIQEELLWICEAAHTPVIWATQVFENLVKTGVPTRSEVTDAAMSERAECVMLNKGPGVGEAVKLLDRIIVRCRAISSRNVPNCARSSPGHSCPEGGLHRQGHFQAGAHLRPAEDRSLTYPCANQAATNSRIAGVSRRVIISAGPISYSSSITVRLKLSKTSDNVPSARAGSGNVQANWPFRAEGSSSLIGSPVSLSEMM